MIFLVIFLLVVSEARFVSMITDHLQVQASRSHVPVGKTQETPCCIELGRDVTLDPGDDFDVVTIETGRHNPKLLVASWRERFFISSDGGDKWKETDFDSIDPLGYGVFPPHPKNPRIMYRIVEQPNSVWKHRLERSSDGGRTWIGQKCLLKSTNLSIGVSKLLYHPIDPNTIYAYGGLSNAGDSLNGIYLSRDGGQSFSFVYCTSSATFAISVSNPDVIYARGTSQSIVKSIDGGGIWNLVGQNDAIRLFGKQSDQLNNILQIVIDPREANITYLVSRKGIIRTTDGGVSWCNLNLGGNLNTSIRCMALSPLDSATIFAGTSRGLFKSNQGGCGWQKVDIVNRMVK